MSFSTMTQPNAPPYTSRLKREWVWKIGHSLYFDIRYSASQWPRGLRHRFCGRSPAEIVGSNPTGDTDACCDCCVLSRRGLCDEMITRPEESYRVRCFVECDLETS